MNTRALRKNYDRILEKADITINGSRPSDIQVTDERLYRRVVKYQSLGLGEAYMDGWWTSDNLEETFFRLFRANLYSEVIKSWRFALQLAAHAIINQQTNKRSYKNARSHYDIGNDLYEPMLGTSMAYSCGYWKQGVKTLEQAQEAKYQLICEKLKLEKSETVLDIGAGWGGLARYMAENYHVKVTALTPAQEQVTFIKRELARISVTPILTTYQDYHPPEESFDKIVSVGMFEHVGPRNHDTFFKTCETWLKPGGLFLVHSITGTTPLNTNDPWIEKYIFPGGNLPALSQMVQNAEKYFVIEDTHNFGNDYHKTLMAWHRNFRKAYPKLDHKKYDERFKRMWEFYLFCCAANFRARKLQLQQMVLSKDRLGTYTAPR